MVLPLCWAESEMSFSLFLFFLLLQPLQTSWNNDFRSCFQYLKPSVQREGDLILGGFFPLYYVNQEASVIRLSFLLEPYHSEMPHRWFWKNYQHVLAFYFAIEQINRDPHLLPNLTVGFQLYNAFPSDSRTLETTLMMLYGGDEVLPNYDCKTQHRSVAIIAGTSPAFSAEIGALLELYKIPQVTYGPFDPMLSDKDQFPSLYQMAPKDSSLVHAIISLLLHFGWTWVAIFISDDLKGEQFLQGLNAEMAKKDICVALTQRLPATKTMYGSSDITFMTRIGVSSANVNILYGEVGSLITVDLAAEFFLTTGKVWIMAAKWDIVVYEMKHMLHSFHGSFSFSHHKGEIPGFKHFLKTVNPSQYPEDFYFSLLWILFFDCSLAGSSCGKTGACQPNISLESLPGDIDIMTLSDSSYFIYNAVYTVAHVLHIILLEKIAKGSPEEAEQPRLPPWQVSLLQEQARVEHLLAPAGILVRCIMTVFSSPDQQDQARWNMGTFTLAPGISGAVIHVLHPFLKKIQFTNSAGQHISLDKKGNHVAQYDIQNAVNFPAGLGLLVKVGEFVSMSPLHQCLVINEEIIEWPIGFTQIPQSVCSQSCGPGFRRIPQEGRPVCCFTCVLCPERHVSNNTDAEQCTQCLPHEYPNTERNRCLPKAVAFLAYEDALGMALACAALGFSALTAGVLGVFVKYRDSAIVKANNRALSYVLLVSLSFCFLCSLLFIGRPNMATCILQQITFGVVFSVAVSTVLAKTVTVVLAFKATAPGRRMRQLLVSGAPNFIIPICSLIQLMLCGIWLGTSPPFIDTDSHSEHGHIIIVCNKGSVTAFYCVLGYLGSLALGSFTVAFLARNLPDTFNEAKFLTFSTLLFCSVWVTFLPVYHSTKGKAMVAVEVFSILASSAGLLGCIFAPKCYIILIRPDKTFKGLKDRRISMKNKHYKDLIHKSSSHF